MKNLNMPENGAETEAKATEKNDGGVTTGGSSRLHCLTIIGQIEGHSLLPETQKATKYEHIVPLIVSVEESEAIDGLLIILNTAGGDVEAGLAIAELIASMKKPTVSLVLGGGHSIGVPLAVSAKYSLIVPTATMTLHPVRMSGVVIGAPQTYFYFDRMQDRIVKFIGTHSKAEPGRLRELLMKTDELATDLGSLLDGEAAVREGIIDAVGGLGDALDALKRQIEENKKLRRGES